LKTLESNPLIITSYYWQCCSYRNSYCTRRRWICTAVARSMK